MARIALFSLALSFILMPGELSAQLKTRGHGVVTEVSREDVNKVNEYLRLSQQFIERSEYDAAKKEADHALEHAKNAEYSKGIATAQQLQAIVLYDQRKYTDASDLFTASLELSEKNGYHDLEAKNLSYLGAIDGSQRKNADGLQKCAEALRIATEHQDKRGQVIANFHIATMHRSQGAFDEALEHFSKALALAEEINYAWAVATIRTWIGTIYAQRGSYEDALKNFTPALELWKQLNNRPRIADGYHYIGAVLFYRSNYADALSNYLTALKIRQEISDSLKIAESYHDIGHIYYKTDNFQEALSNYFSALEIFKKSGNKQRTGLAHSSVANAYADLGEGSLALENYKASIALQEELGDKPSLIYSYNNVATVYLNNNDFDTAEKNLDAAEQLGKELGEIEGLSLTYQHKGRIALRKKQFAKAKEFAGQSISLSKQTGNKNMLMQAYHVMSAVDSAMHNFPQALAHYKLYKSIADSIRSEESEKTIADLKVAYETEKKDQEIATQKAESELQAMKLKKQTLLKNYLAGSLILLALLGFFAYSYIITRQKLKLQTLRNKIASDLHDDVGSTLSSIAIFSEIAQKQSKEVEPLLNTITEGSRQMLDAMADIVWTINPENDQFEKILLRMRSYAYELLGAKKIGFDFQIDENVTNLKLPMDVRKNLFLIFKEATNNLAKYSEADKALFSIKNDKDQLSMMIRDNGKGFDLNKPTEGNGLKNMQKRAKEIDGNLRIESLPANGTSIHFKIAI